MGYLSTPLSKIAQRLLANTVGEPLCSSLRSLIERLTIAGWIKSIKIMRNDDLSIKDIYLDFGKTVPHQPARTISIRIMKFNSNEWRSHLEVDNRDVGGRGRYRSQEEAGAAIAGYLKDEFIRIHHPYHARSDSPTIALQDLRADNRSIVTKGTQGTIGSFHQISRDEVAVVVDFPKGQCH